jgi:hypothetical protein
MRTRKPDRASLELDDDSGPLKLPPRAGPDEYARTREPRG